MTSLSGRAFAIIIVAFLLLLGLIGIALDAKSREDERINVQSVKLTQEARRILHDEHLICQNSRDVRSPFETFIVSELRLEAKARALGAQSAQPPAIRALQAQANRNLAALGEALRTAQAKGCPAQ